MTWWRRLVRARMPWPVFIGQCLIFLVLMYGLGWWFLGHYEIGIAQGKPCLPGRFYMIELRVEDRLPEFKRGDLIVFRTDQRTMPWYQPGTRFVKVVRGVPGDRVVIDGSGKVQIIGQDYHFESALEPQVVELLGKKTGDLAVEYHIPERGYFAMGTLPDSYDSRYWGLVQPDQIVGKGLVTLGR